MTYIFEVFTSPREGRTLTGVVQYRDPYDSGFSQGPVFGLQLLMEAWREGVGSVSSETAAEFDELFELYFEGQARERGKSPADAFARRTAEIVTHFALDPYDGEPEAGEGSSAFFTLEVSDPRYLAHFALGRLFRTAFTGHLPGLPGHG
ncbi:hypothetical protein [Streptomyces luteolus]|uniref:Uncharacterized protein n=1 Tax=Streptomyces luteolus TaxID=3043615 RepID=A0ABT6T5F1_9ACTN|nr:hypothetical protein [Streptomyces sp. B-S-A12]MDI3423103.1 hypothetical protein [Streptomyces sp. B-S-A12]